MRFSARVFGEGRVAAHGSEGTLMKFLRFCAYTALLGLLPLSGGQAGEFLTGNDYAPYTDEKLPDGGFATELVTAVLTGMGESPRIRFFPWKRGYQMTMSGEALGTFPYVRNPDREAEMLFSEPLYHDISRIFSAKARPLAYNDVESLKGKTFCNPTGYVVYPEIKGLLDAKELRLQDPADMSGCLKSLDVGRADFIISSSSVVTALSADLGLSGKFAAAEKPFRENASYLLIGKNTAGGPAFMAKFNASLSAYRASAAYAALVKKHGLEGAIR